MSQEQAFNLNQTFLHLLSHSAQKKALWTLVFWHVLIIASSNYLVQIPFTIFGYHTTWGAFSFPFIFLTTDLTVRLFGAPLARRIVLWAMLPAFFVSYAMSVLFYNGEFTGLEALQQINTMVMRIAFASFLAYLLGQLLDIKVFSRLRALPLWWVAPSVSTVVGNLLDTIVFFSFAFYRSSDAYMAEHWVEIAQVDYLWKLIICTLFFLPAYGVLLRYLSRKLQD